MLNSAVSMVSVACALGGSQGFGCLQAKVYGLGVLAYGSFTSPVGPARGLAAGLLGAMLSWGRLPFETAENIFLKLMLSAVGRIRCQ